MKCLAIIANSLPYGDSSQICQAFSPELGAFSLIAKGIRRKGCTLQKMCEYELSLHPPKEEGLYLLKDAWLKRDYSSFGSTESWVAADCGMELLGKLMIALPEAPEYYKLLVDYLGYLGKVKRNSIFIFWRFFLRIFRFLGIPLETDFCDICKTPQRIMAFDNSGGIYCKECGTYAHFQAFSPLARELWQALPTIARHLDDYQPDRTSLSQINSLLLCYMESQHKKSFQLKSLKVLMQFYPEKEAQITKPVLQ